MKRKGKHPAAAKVVKSKPKARGWKTTDEEEIERRRLRATLEPMAFESLEPEQPYYGTFSVRSKRTGRMYLVEIRSLTGLENSCQCKDYLKNGLGTCKHIEALLSHLEKGGVRKFRKAAGGSSPRVEVFLSRRGGAPRVMVSWPVEVSKTVREIVSPYFSSDDVLLGDPAKAVPALKRELAGRHQRARRKVRVGRDVEDWVGDLQRRGEHAKAREAFLRDVESGKRTMDFLRHELYPYQREGMLHLAFGERSLLADDMGLGKTVQAIGAAELLRRTRGVERVLVVSPASLKAEWEEQIAKFTGLPSLVIWGPRRERLKSYRKRSFFYLTNYEQVRNDLEDINRLLAPDIVILDEAQRIKNWQTKTAGAIKELASPYAFVLTGTPLENRIDEIYSIVEFLDPHIFGPLFRFNREYYVLDDKGRPAGYKNLEEMHRRIRPVMLRRRKDEIEDQLPGRTVNNYFVEMEPEQRKRYEEYNDKVARLLARADKRPLTKEEFEMLQRWLACMRMLCDTPYILDPNCRICPKLGELADVFEENLSGNGAKMLVFSEWERMLRLVRELAGEMGLAFAWHTGSVPQKKRREEIRRFKEDGSCSLFLSTDSGSVGLNLQEASVVVNLDLPWNPAKLEQRIARAWRKFQKKPVSIINLVTENSIENRMLATLAQKQELADGILDGRGDLAAIRMPSGRAAFLERLEAVMGMKAERVAVPAPRKPELPAVPEDPYAAFRDGMLARLADRLLAIESCRGPGDRPAFLAVVEGPAEQSRPLAERLLRESFAGSEETPALDLIDRTTYDTMKRLADAGFLQFGKGEVRRLHSSDAFPDEVSSKKERLLEEARGIFSGTDRKMRMSALLTEGGFTLEALAPLGEALEIAVKAAARLAGQEVPAGGEPALTLLESSVVPAGYLPPDAVAVVATLRESRREPGGMDEETARKLIEGARGIVDHVSREIKKAALK